MTLRLLSFICTVTAASIAASCGGGALSGGADAKKENKATGAESASDEDATDPQVIAGAYLTCDYTSQAKSEVGCAVQYEGNNLAPTKSERIDYFAQTNGTKNSPKNPSTNMNYPAVFTASDNVKPSTIATTKFSAILTGPKGSKQWSCDGANLPCRAALMKLSGYWTGGDAMTDTFIDKSTADVFCDSSGVKSKTEIVDAFKKWNPIVALGSIVANPPSESQKINSVQSLPDCKKPTKTGTNCSVVPVKLKGSNILSVLVYKNTSDLAKRLDEVNTIQQSCP